MSLGPSPLPDPAGVIPFGKFKPMPPTRSLTYSSLYRADLRSVRPLLGKVKLFLFGRK
jgi:hypothetical protein